MSHLQFPTLLTHPRILWDCAIWHPQHHHDSCLSLCRQQRQPLRHGFGAEALRVVNAVCPPRCRQPSHNSPAEDYFCWLVVMLAHICQRCHFSQPVVPHTTSLRLWEEFCVTGVRGKGHLSGIVLKVQPKVSVAVALVSYCYGRILVHHWQNILLYKNWVLKTQDE